MSATTETDADMSKPDYRKLGKAYKAIELACLINDTDSAEFARADKAMQDLLGRTISKSEFDYYVGREEERRMLHYRKSS